MKEIAAGKFKAECLALMEEVQQTGKPLIVTKRGKPLVKLVPAENKSDSIFGYMRGRANSVGDIVGPVADPDEWKAGR